MAPQKATKYTPERTKRILDAVAMGATRKLACMYAGIDPDTLIQWERRFRDFKAAMVEAEGRAGIGWLAKIEKAANEGDWRAAAYKLEKLYPDEYGKTVQEQRGSVRVEVVYADADDHPAASPPGAAPDHQGGEAL